ncbi:MAG TPA: UDP-3-O-(3-hydroxymyristoyl)glucosamine N-acyltransferase [Candidatus Aminicenantes bacterium]|nr:UDP-3-O-(3-hydroxymyristoyl)glucosamine N-acyltransferase [Candidatus Aminicenantes bacterium]
MTDLKTIAERIGGTLDGDGTLPIDGVNTPERASEREIAFLAPERPLPKPCRAAALVLKRGSPLAHPSRILVDEPHEAFARLLALFHPRSPAPPGVHPTAVVGAGVTLGEGVSIGPLTVLGDGVVIGAGSEIHGGVHLYPGVRIGAHCLIYARVVVREQCSLGDRVIVQPGAIIGGDGFGFAHRRDGSPVKIPQVGRVVIGDDCEIGAGTCVDRATLGETVLAAGVKLDNLVQIGHNVHIGRYTAISAQSGISGSTVIGERVIMGGQVGVADHLNLADGVMVAAKSGISGSIKTAMVVAGTPHMEMSRWRRNYATLRNLDEMRRRLAELEKKFASLEETR